MRIEEAKMIDGSGAFIDDESAIRNPPIRNGETLMDIPPFVSEWLNLLVRWAHVFAGILWIGTTYFFTWLDGSFTDAERAGGDGKRQVWMVHSGGFYVVDKTKEPDLDQHLHWFRWEALLTWLSGFVLLVLVYYLGGALVDPDVLDIGTGTAVALSLGIILVARVRLRRAAAHAARQQRPRLRRSSPSPSSSASPTASRTSSAVAPPTSTSAPSSAPSWSSTSGCTSSPPSAR